MARRRLAGLLIAGAVLVGPAWGYEEASVPDGGSLTGSVKFAGVPPGVPAIPVKKNRDVCGERTQSEALVVGPNKGVENAVIVVEGVTKGKPAERELTLDNAKCLFVPHVSAVMVRAPAKVKNSDPILHNTHGFLERITVFNLALPTQNQVIDITKRLKKPGVVRVMCDAHTHMFAWIVVHDSPYFAVTGEDGNFKIDGIPPGKYKVSMWHEGFMSRGFDSDGRPLYDEPRIATKEVSIPAKGVATVEFELK